MAENGKHEHFNDTERKNFGSFGDMLEGRQVAYDINDDKGIDPKYKNRKRPMKEPIEERKRWRGENNGSNGLEDLGDEEEIRYRPTSR